MRLRFCQWFPAVAVAAGLFVTGASPPTAQGWFTLTLTDEGTGATQTFTGTGGMVGPGWVTVGGFTVNVSGTSSAPANNPADVQQATVTFSYKGTGADKLDVVIQDNGFTGYGKGVPVTLDGAISTTKVAAGVIGTAHAFYIDDLGTTTTSDVQEAGPISAPSGIGTGSSTLLTSGSASSFTLGSDLVISVSGSSGSIQSNFTVDANTTPEPASAPAPSNLVLFGIGAGAAGATWLVRRRKVLSLTA